MESGGLELWGGLEATVCRIRDEYVDQTVRCGHHERIEDLEKIASLGVTHLRYPVLWERIAPNGLQSADWSWTDERLDALRRLGITPIATLMHHGSGPRDTNLLDPQLPGKLAEFAGAVARRYPWLQCFTPVNEPCTTARFSALYGWWYPHERSERAFYAALLNEVAATRTAMDAIREHIPAAKLITTEDLGKTYATPRLEYQAEHENHRRLLTYDLLCGRLDLNPPMQRRLARLGFCLDDTALEALTCVPDVLGFNYYVTGERWLDERLSLYPAQYHGGNDYHAYADIEAVRARADGICGPGPLLRECWERYGLPMAITEAHLACAYDEQIRWLRDVYTHLLALRDEGVDVRAFTVWSLLGAYEWNSVLTRRDGFYESGAFDVSSGTAVETPVGEFVRKLAASPSEALSSITGTGWWARDDRLLYGNSRPAA